MNLHVIQKKKHNTTRAKKKKKTQEQKTKLALVHGRFQIQATWI